MARATNHSVSDDQIFRVIDKIYDTALDPTQWTELLCVIGILVDAPQGSLMLSSPSKKTMSDFGYGRNDDMRSRYNTMFLGEDRWFEAAARLPLGSVVTGQELCETRTFEHTPYYQECLRLGEIYDCLGVILEGGRDLNAAISFQRPPSVSVFDRAEVKLFSLLVPHLRRLVQIHRKFESLSVMSAIEADVLNQISFGVVIINGDGIQFANRAAQDIATQNDGLHFSRKGLVAGHPEDNVALAEAQIRAARPRSSNLPGPRGSTVAVRRPSLKRPYTVHAMPISDHVLGATRILGGNDAAILVTITDPTAARRPAADVLIQAYGLTPTEAVGVEDRGRCLPQGRWGSAFHLRTDCPLAFEERARED